MGNKDNQKKKTSCLQCTFTYCVKMCSLKYCILNVDASVWAWPKETC